MQDEVRRRAIPLWIDGVEPDMTGKINMLQIEDARRGLMPRPRPSGASKYHNMYHASLFELAIKRGFDKQHSRSTQDSATLIKFLLSQDTPSAAFEQNADAASMQLAAKMLVDDLSESLGQLAADSTSSTRTTDNGGIVAPAEALNSLSETLMHNWFPTRTSAAGFLCGPRALAASLEEHRFQWRRQHPEDTAVLPTLTVDDLMSLLFDDYVPGEFVAPGTRGKPTPLYAAYIESMIGHFRDMDPALYQDILNDTYLPLDDLSIQQLEAMLSLLWDQGRIEQQYGLGVVTGESSPIHIYEEFILNTT